MEQIIEAQYINLLLFGYKKFVGAQPNKDLSHLKNWSKELQDKILGKLFDKTEIAKFSQKELYEYENRLKAYRDIKNAIDTAREIGYLKGREEYLAKQREEGRDERSIEIAREMLAGNEAIDKIMRYTGLSEAQIKELI